MMPGLRPCRGFTLPELLISIVILVILATLLSALGRDFISRGHAANCSSNLRQIGMATMMYAGDNHMSLPVTSHQRRQGGKSWTITLQPYASGTITFKCPKDPDKSRVYTYLINDFLTPGPAGAPDLDFSRLAKIERPAATLMFGEASPTYRNTDHFHFSVYRGGVVPAESFEKQAATRAHGEQANYLFADGHVETLRRNEAVYRLSASGSCFIEPSSGTTP
jgi:prepilin-type N-terminal cleavage/methylation domain-containing protein/prepilin-type processing-associated H-X9-DG protein